MNLVLTEQAIIKQTSLLKDRYRVILEMIDSFLEQQTQVIIFLQIK